MATKTHALKMIKATFSVPSIYFGDDSLEKAYKAAPHAVHYGHAGVLPIIAIGPHGGKIVGYSKGKPIYQGTPEAAHLAFQYHQHIEHGKSDEATKLLAEHHPAVHEMLDFGASMAAGDHAHPAFPEDLHTLKEIPSGKYGGSHGNKLFVAPDGRKYIFKSENPTIARAEEAVSRLARLLLGPGKVQDAKYVQLSGADGVLINVIEDAEPLGPEHKTTPPATAKMQEHFDDIVQQHALDWLVSNHDAHGENFLIDPKGKLVGIDKGQAWKFVGKDELSPDYNPNASSQVYHFFWNQVKEGKLKGNPLASLQSFFSNLQQISDEQFKAIVAPYVSLRAGAQEVQAKTIEKKLVDRFHQAKSNWEWFLGQMYPNHQDVEGYGPQKHVPIGTGTPTVNQTMPMAAIPVIPTIPAKLKGTAILSAPPSAVKDSSVAASISGGSGDALSAGTKITLQKKGIEGKVTLEVIAPKKFKVHFENAKYAAVSGKEFASPTTAGDHVWMVGQGYQDVADFKTKNPGKKLASGAGWKYWGVKPGEEGKLFSQVPAVGLEQVKPESLVVAKVGSPAPEPVVDLAAFDASKIPTSASKTKAWDAMPMLEDAHLIGASHIPKVGFDKMEPGTKIAWLEDDSGKIGQQVAEKNEDGTWSTKWDDGTASTLDSKGLVMQMTEAVNDKLAVSSPAPAAPAGVDGGSGWKVYKTSEVQKLNFWLKQPMGTWASWTGPDGAYDAFLVKEEGKAPWKVTGKGEVKYLTFSAVQELAQQAMDGEVAIKQTELTAEASAPKTSPQPATKPMMAKSILTAITDPYVMGKKVAGDKLTFFQKIENVEKLMSKWASTKTDDGLHFIGEKPPGQAAWVPPAGVWIEGEYGGKKVFFATVVSGYGTEGQTMAMVNFAVVDTSGKVTVLEDPVPAEKAAERLKEVLVKHFEAGGLEITDVFHHALDNVFPAGVTADTASDVQPSMYPAGVIGTAQIVGNPLDLEGPAAMQPVKLELPLQEAWANIPEVAQYGGKLKLKPSAQNPALYNIILDTVPGYTPEQLTQVLKDFATKYGITPAYANHPKTNPIGALMSVKSADIMATKVPVTMPANAVPPSEVTPGADNFETMPDVQGDPYAAQKLAQELTHHPKKIFATWAKTGKAGPALDALPEGAILTLGNGVKFQKTAKAPNGYDQWFQIDEFGEKVKHGAGSPYGHSTFAMTQKIANQKGAIISAPGAITVPVPKAKAPKATAPKWTPPPPDPEKEAKKAWAKDNKPISPEQTKHLSWWLKKHGFEGEELIARQTTSGNLLLGGNASVEYALKEVGVPVPSPHGILYAVPWSTIKDATPEATTVKGPDGAEYPYGTKFEQEASPIPLEVKLKQEQGFHKIVDYKGPDSSKYQKTVKYLGNTLATKAMAEATIKKFNLQTPILQGSGNTLFFVSNDQLKAKAGEEITVKTKIPKQPTSPKLKSVGVASGSGNEGQPAPINRDDLGAMESIIPPRCGHTVRFGAGGILMDGQLKIFRVQMPDGTMVHRVVGELTKDPPALDEKKSFKFWGAASSKPDKLFGGLWKEHDFDPKTGVSVLSDKTPSGDSNNCWSHGEAKTSGAELTDGSSVYVFRRAVASSYGYKNEQVIETYRRTFVVDVPMGHSIEGAVAEAMGKLKVPVDEAMAQPSDDDERILKKIQILRSHYGAMGFKKVAELGLMDKPKAERESILDAQLKGKIAKKYVDSARVVVGVEGTHQVELDDLDEELGPNVKGVVTGISLEGIARVFQQGSYVSQGGSMWSGNTRNIDAGSNLASADSDMMQGGGFGRFYTLINNHNDTCKPNVGAKSKPKFVLHPKVLKKTNWYGANGDTYGKQTPNGDQRTRSGAMSISEGDNEIMIDNVSPSDIVGAIVASDESKHQLIDYLQKMGFNEINGCPLTEFVVVGDVTYNISSSLAKMPLLKE
jgi:hypothetical protein